MIEQAFFSGMLTANDLQLLQNEKCLEILQMNHTMLSVVCPF